jgi:hypothetical protein
MSDWKPTPETIEKVLNACHRLNAEAYEKQVLARGKALKHFEPCAKAEVLMAVIRENKHFGTAHAVAASTICPCHNSLTDAQLMDYQYDETYKKANYAHDLKTLYPRLYRIPAD